MMTSGHGKAHGVSLPLFALLQRVEEEGAASASLRVRTGVHNLCLDKDIEVVLVIAKGHTSIGMEPRSTFGEMILREVMARSDFAPCPDESCEYAEDGACKWCGRIPRQ
jgi:hypothetical protein